MPVNVFCEKLKVHYAAQVASYAILQTKILYIVFLYLNSTSRWQQ